MRFFTFVILFIGVCTPAGAQGADMRSMLEMLVERTPGSLLQDMRHKPERFLEEAAGVVLGFGGPDGIDAAGLADAIDAQRASIRAREIRRLLQADLNDDLVIDTRERDIAISTASATMRGRLLNWHLRADSSRDGTVSWEELRAFAHDVSLESFSESRAQDIFSLIVFDLDRNGRVTVTELRDAVEAMADEAPPAILGSLQGQKI